MSEQKRLLASLDVLIDEAIQHGHKPDTIVVSKTNRTKIIDAIKIVESLADETAHITSYRYLNIKIDDNFDDSVVAICGPGTVLLS